MIDSSWAICPYPYKYRSTLTRRLGCHDWPSFGQVHTPSLWLVGVRKWQCIFESHCGLSWWGKGDTSQKKRGCYFWNKRGKDILGRKEKNVCLLRFDLYFRNFRPLLGIIDNLFTLSLDITKSYLKLFRSWKCNNEIWWFINQHSWRDLCYYTALITEHV